MYDVIILAGGQGNRMAHELPKVLVPVKGKPMLFHRLDYFLGKVPHIIISIGHRGGEIMQTVHKAYPHQKEILFAQEKKPLGTAGGIKQAAQLATTPMVIVLNADDFITIPLETLFAIQENTITVAHPILPYGLVEEKDGFASFHEKPTLDCWVNCGCYILQRKDILERFPNEGSVEYDVFPKMKFRVLHNECTWVPLTTKKDILEFEKI